MAFPGHMIRKSVKCKTCGGTLPNHVPSMFDKWGTSHPEHKVKDYRPRVVPLTSDYGHTQEDVVAKIEFADTPKGRLLFRLLKDKPDIFEFGVSYSEHPDGTKQLHEVSMYTKQPERLELEYRELQKGEALELLVESMNWSTRYMRAYLREGPEAAERVNEEWTLWISEMKKRVRE